MGWNDRLHEDPYTPFFNEQDRIEYEEWQQYLLACSQLDADCRGPSTEDVKLPEVETTQPQAHKDGTTEEGSPPPLTLQPAP